MSKIGIYVAVLCLAGCGQAANELESAGGAHPSTSLAPKPTEATAIPSPSTSKEEQAQTVSVKSLSSKAETFLGPPTIHVDYEVVTAEDLIKATDVVVIATVTSIGSSYLNTRTGGWVMSSALLRGLDAPSITPLTDIDISVEEVLGEVAGGSSKLGLETGQPTRVTLVGGAVMLTMPARVAYEERITPLLPKEWDPPVADDDLLSLEISQSTELNLRVGDRVVAYLTSRALVSAEPSTAGEPLRLDETLSPAYAGFGITRLGKDDRIEPSEWISGMPKNLSEARAFAAKLR